MNIVCTLNIIEVYSYKEVRSCMRGGFVTMLTVD